MIFLFTFALACTNEEKLKLSCENYCKFVYDQKGLIYETKKCLCGEDADLNKFILKLPRPVPEKKEVKKYNYDY